MCSKKTDKSAGVIYAQAGKIADFTNQKEYPEKIRKMKLFDTENKKNATYLQITSTCESNKLSFSQISKGRLNYSSNGLNNIWILAAHGEQQKRLFPLAITS